MTAVTAWRVVRTKYAEPPFNPFDGEGSRRVGGRWNSPGVPVVYVSESLSLALLEILVHAGSLSTIPDHVAFRLVIPAALVSGVPADRLPPDWRAPDPPAALRQFGDDWAAGLTSPVLRVPSAVVPVEHNYVLNPRHPDFGKITVGGREPLPIDPRLLKMYPPAAAARPAR